MSNRNYTLLEQIFQALSEEDSAYSLGMLLGTKAGEWAAKKVRRALRLDH